MNAAARNPVIPGFHPDPSACWFRDRFVLVTSSFEYFPAIPVFVSEDLGTWSQVGHAVVTEEQADLSRSGSSQGFFAPTIRAHGDRLYLVVTNVNRPGQLLFTATAPEGPWLGPVVIDQNGIDPSLFFGDAGEVLLQSNVEPDPAGDHAESPAFRRGIQQSRIDPSSGEILDGPRLIWEGAGGRFPEAPHLYRREGFYYLLIAEGGTERGHTATMARSRSPWGPFEAHPRNPVLSHRSLANPVQSVGHADLFDAPDGRSWAVCLGVRPVREWHHLGRETFLVPVVWHEDGWPEFGDDGVVPVVIPGVPAPNPGDVDVDTFADGALEARWNTLRRPLGARLSVRDGLRLQGAAADLDDLDVSFVGRRLQHMDAFVRAQLEASGTGEAGVVIRADERHFAALGVRMREGRSELFWRRRIGDLEVATPCGPCSGHWEARLELSAHECRFTAVTDEGERVIGAFPLRYLSSEVVGGFTGVYIGLYAVDALAQLVCRSFSYQAGMGPAATAGMS